MWALWMLFFLFCCGSVDGVISPFDRRVRPQRQRVSPHDVDVIHHTMRVMTKPKVVVDRSIVESLPIRVFRKVTSLSFFLSFFLMRDRSMSIMSNT